MSSHHSRVSGSGGGCGWGLVVGDSSCHWHASHHWSAHHSWVVHWGWHASLSNHAWSSFLSLLRCHINFLFFETQHVILLAAENTNTEAANEWYDDNDSDDSSTDSISSSESIIKVFNIWKIIWIINSLAHCNVRLANSWEIVDDLLCFISEILRELWGVIEPIRWHINIGGSVEWCVVDNTILSGWGASFESELVLGNLVNVSLCVLFWRVIGVWVEVIERWLDISQAAFRFACVVTEARITSLDIAQLSRSNSNK